MSNPLTNLNVKRIHELLELLSPAMAHELVVDDSEGVLKPKRLSLSNLAKLLVPYNGAVNDVDLGAHDIKTPNYTEALSLATLAEREYLAVALSKLAKVTSVVIAQLDGKSAYRGTLLASGYNLNDIAKTGTYTAPANAVNSPVFSESVSEINYIMHINSDSATTSAVQLAIGATTSHIYLRNKIGTAWSAWSIGITPTEIGYLKSVTSNVQAQLNALATNKQNISDKTNVWSEEPNDQRYPSEKLVKDSLDEQAGRLDTLEADELTEGSIAYDIKQSSDALKGVDYTEGSLKTHEDRLDTLEGADTVVGSVAKTVKDAVEPIIEDVSDHESRLDTTELTLARQGQDLASVKQTLQQGNGATLDFEDIGIVPLDARATGRANPTVEGRTATNYMNGKGDSLEGWYHTNYMATNGEYFTFPSSAFTYRPASLMVFSAKAGDKILLLATFYRTGGLSKTYFSLSPYTDPLTNTIDILYDFASLNYGESVGITSVQTITTLTDDCKFLGFAFGGNTIVFTGEIFIKDLMPINLTSIYGAGNEPTASDCAKIFSYFDGTKSIQLPARVRSVSEDESESSTLYIADNEEVRSVQAVSDEVKVVNGQLVKVQRVHSFITQASDFIYIDNVVNTNNSWIRVKKQLDDSLYGISLSSLTNSKKYFISGYTAVANRSNDSAPIAGYFVVNYSNVALDISVPKGTYASLAAAQADLAGTVIYYQLATPIITPLTTSGILQAKPNGTVYFEPYYEGSHQTDASSQITLPYEGTIDKLTGYDENLEPYEVPSTGYTLVGTLLTVTGAEKNEVYYVELSRSEPLAPEMEVNVINNEQVIADTTNGKFYKLVQTITNGALVSQTPVEVV